MPKEEEIPIIKWTKAYLKFILVHRADEMYRLTRKEKHYMKDKDREEYGAYSSFARVYDTFMDNVPYKEWGRYIYGILCEYGVKEGIVLDLGCGTGTMTEILAGYGYDMIG